MLSARSESDLDELLQQRLEQRRTRLNKWLSQFRVGGAVAWLVFALAFDWRTPPWMLGTYLALAVALLVAARFVPLLARQPALGVVGIDMPAICLIQYSALANTPNTVVALATVVAIGCEFALCERAGIPREDYLHALVLVMGAAAASFVSRQVLRLVHDVTREQSARQRLGRYFSPQVAKRIAELGGAAQSGQHSEVTPLRCPWRASPSPWPPSFPAAASRCCPLPGRRPCSTARLPSRCAS